MEGRKGIRRKGDREWEGRERLGDRESGRERGKRGGGGGRGGSGEAHVVPSACNVRLVATSGR